MKVFRAIRALAAPALAIAVPAVAAADDVGHWYITPQIGAIVVDNDRPLEDKDYLYGLALGRAVSKGLNIELNFNGAQLDGRPGFNDSTLFGGSLDFLGVFARGSRVEPFLSAGLGVAQNDRSPGRDATNFMTQVGAGMFIKLWESSAGTSSFGTQSSLGRRRQQRSLS